MKSKDMKSKEASGAFGERKKAPKGCSSERETPRGKPLASSKAASSVSQSQPSETPRSTTVSFQRFRTVSASVGLAILFSFRHVHRVVDGAERSGKIAERCRND